MRSFSTAAIVVAVGLAACGSGSSAVPSNGSDAPRATETSPVTDTASGAPSTGGSQGDSADVAIDSVIASLETSGRVDLDASGNRVIDGPARVIGSEPVRVDLPDGAVPVWIAPTDSTSGRWLVVHADGVTTLVDPADRSATPIEPTGSFDADAGPPLVTGTDARQDGAVRSLFDDPLPDTRVVTDGMRLVALAGPSDRYPHGVLGDAMEATAIEVVDSAGSTTPIRLDEPDVFEAISPMLADIDGDGPMEILSTVSNSSSGARLVAYDLDGTLVAQSEPIGQGNRWRNLLAVAPIGPGGEVEVIDVRTPHIGGTLQFFRLDGDRLDIVARAEGYSTHQIGSRNLDLGVVVDADGDGRLDVLLPVQDRSELVAVTRVADADGGTREIGRVSLRSELTSNVAAATNTDGSVAVAVGTADGSVWIWP